MMHLVRKKVIINDLRVVEEILFENGVKIN